MSNKMPNVLIEDWLPIEAVNADSERECEAASASHDHRIDDDVL